MKRKITILFIAISVLALLLSACGNDIQPPAEPLDTAQTQANDSQPAQVEEATQTQDTETQDEEVDDEDIDEYIEEEPEVETPQEEQQASASDVRGGNPVRGEWDGHVYTSEYLGLRFVLADGWLAASEAEIAQAMGRGEEALVLAGSEFPDNFWDMFEAQVIYDMMASSGFGGASVQVAFERLPPILRRISAQEYIEMSTPLLEQIGMTVNTNFSDATQIGEYYWYSFGFTVDVFGTIMYGYQFINVLDGFVRLIAISYSADSESVEEVVAMFIGLDDPIPEFVPVAAPEIEHEHALIGTWAWDEGPTFTYVFSKDGTLTRGIPGQIEELEWRTEGADHILMGSGIFMESWTFSIVDDVLTITSRQVPGMEFRYIRQ